MNKKAMSKMAIFFVIILIIILAEVLIIFVKLNEINNDNNLFCFKLNKDEFLAFDYVKSDILLFGNKPNNFTEVIYIVNKTTSLYSKELK